jgi:uncharacterized protein YjbJ (UPF0337 family)
MSDKPKLLDRIRDSKFAEFVREKVKPVAGDILEVVGDLTGRDSIERVGQLLNKRKEDNEQMKALAFEFEKYKLEWQLEYDRIKMETGLEEMRLEVQDRDSARTREVEFMKTNGGKRDWLMGVVVICGIVMMFGVLASLVFVNVPEANKELAYMAYGSVLTIGTSIFSYYVGSSRGSAAKDKTIRDMNR